MNTSLGNGVVNYAVIKFICEVLHGKEVTLIVEGDDSLYITEALVTENDYLHCGFTVKLDSHDCLEKASFCGLIFNGDTETVQTNPIKTMLKTPWLPRKWVNASTKMCLQLLKCKALSVAWQYPGCPILGSYAKFLLRMTHKYTVKKSIIDYMNTNDYNFKYVDATLLHMNTDFNTFMNSVPHKPIDNRDRLVMLDKFGISIESQLYLESLFDNKSDLKPIFEPVILSYCHKDYLHNFETHVVTVDNVDCAKRTVLNNTHTERFNLLKCFTKSNFKNHNLIPVVAQTVLAGL